MPMTSAAKPYYELPRRRKILLLFRCPPPPPSRFDFSPVLPGRLFGLDDDEGRGRDSGDTPMPDPPLVLPRNNVAWNSILDCVDIGSLLPTPLGRDCSRISALPANPPTLLCIAMPVIPLGR